MALRRAWLIIAAAGLIGGVFAFQQPFREYPGREYEDFPLPPDYQEKTEWAFARLMYPQYSGGGGYGYYRGRGRYGGDWTQGRSSWTTDYPRHKRITTTQIYAETSLHGMSENYIRALAGKG